MNHGQASVERGFSVNKSILQYNMEEKSLVSQRLIYDHMKSKGLTTENISLSKDFLKSIKASRSRYDEFLTEQKKEKRISEKEKQRGAIEHDILTISEKKSNLETMCTTLTKDFEKLMDKAEKSTNITYVVEANCLKRKRSEKLDEIKELEVMIDSLNKKKKDI